MIKLQTFSEGDFDRLIAEIPNARFLLQWAGPKYTYPLDADQLRETLKNTMGEKPTYQVFKAIRPGTLETCGHFQLMDINYISASCVLGRVLIYQKYRDRGLGQAMLIEAVKVALEILDLDEIRLGVYDFNSPAINVYKSMGFEEFQFNQGAQPFQNENWNVIRMRLNKSTLRGFLTDGISGRSFRSGSTAI